MAVKSFSSSAPASLNGVVATNSVGIPRFWATIWSDALHGGWAATTRRRRLVAVDRFYEAVSSQYGVDCLDRLIANLDGAALEGCLSGFLSQLRNEAAIDKQDRSATWEYVLNFVTEILHFASDASSADAVDIIARLTRIEALYRQLTPNPEKDAPPIRALPALVIEDLYEIFRPDSPRNPFRTMRLRWRNLVIFMILLRLGLRRGECALLYCSSFNEEFDPVTGKQYHWLEVQGTEDDGDPRAEKPGLKTAPSRRRLALPEEIVDLVRIYEWNYRGKVHDPHLVMSQEGSPLSLRSFNDIFEAATKALSDDAKRSLAAQGLTSVSCHDLRHTSAVARMKRYEEDGIAIDKAQEKLRKFFGWSKTSEMPLLYAAAYFDTTHDEVWREKFDRFVNSLRAINPEPSR
ncbi:site-specific recombinase [Rhizobium hidalgonense]|uniref:site-specific integrase n=1 Tax=Rhizobium hidalgonense TaxID=1538159 RepID=UPI000FEC79C5|nr:site-specific integrase [Rhizobium hidalgonense]RWX20055.1 site-specific recombinase [Rhizobium hidalgonense]